VLEYLLRLEDFGSREPLKYPSHWRLDSGHADGLNALATHR
jgi:hypothetical protein